jgi:hypothetical protein
MTRQLKNRREFIASTAMAGSAASMLLAPGRAWADAEAPELAGRKPFVLYVHFGSMCGVASGLAQPIVPGTWQTGFFTAGATGGSTNPLLNQHSKYGSLVFHEYNHMLADIADDLCLANGTPESLDHFVAGRMQSEGSAIPNAAPQWAMGVTQFSRTSANPNPMLISTGTKTLSVPDVSLVNASSVAAFKTITSDPATLPNTFSSPIWDVLRTRYQIKSLGSTAVPANVGSSLDQQLKVLTGGMPALNAATADIDSLTAALSPTAFASIKDYLADKAAVTMNVAFRDQLILAGTLAKTGLASGMTIIQGGNDLHFGGADIDTARDASGKWALLTLFWKWCKQNQLDNDVLVIVSHDFGRSPFNTVYVDRPVVTSSGTQTVRSPGRDHGLYFGMMFFNKNVPSKGRIGNVANNFTPVASTDAAGGFDATAGAHLASHIVGSMLMRVYPSLFKTERMVRKHWPDFLEVKALLNG